MPFLSSKIPVLINVLLIIETSCPEPVNPRFVSNSFRSNAAIIFVLLLFAIEVISFLFIASLLITGVNANTSSHILDINSVNSAFLFIFNILPQKIYSDLYSSGLVYPLIKRLITSRKSSYITSYSSNKILSSFASSLNRETALNSLTIFSISL